MAPESYPVLIVGAGPTGLVLALTLLQSGVPARIIDKAPGPYIGSRGLGITPRSLEVYNLLGVLPDILKAATPPPPRRMYSLSAGKEESKGLQWGTRSYPTPGMPYLNLFMLGQDVLLGILRSHLEKYGRKVEFGTELHTFEQHSDHVETHLIRHADGNAITETVFASYMVGADGAKGVVRKVLGIPFDGETREQGGGVLADVRLRGLSRDCMHMWGDLNSRGFSVMPRFTHDDDVFWVVLFGAEIDHDKALSDPEIIKEYVKEITKRPDIEITEFLSTSSFRWNIRMVSEFRRDRVFIAGDAAHVHSPTGGQGLNSSIMDAFNLAWKLSLVHGGVASAKLLDSYSDERLPIIRNMLQVTTEILDKALADVETAWERGRKLYQLDVSYRGSPIVLNERKVDVLEVAPPNVYTFGSLGAIQAGDRAPDAPRLLGLKMASLHVTSLFNIFKPSQHTVLILSPSAALADSVVEVLHDYPSNIAQTVSILPSRIAIRENQVLANTDLVVKDCDGHAYEGYSADQWKHELTVVIVRPDSFIGAIGNEVQIVKDYFERIFG